MSDPNANNRASNRFVEKGDFLKVDNITLGYSFDKSVIEKVSLSKFRVYAVLQNAIMFTKYTGIDPEMESTGMDYNSVPRQMTFSMGINATF